MDREETSKKVYQRALALYKEGITDSALIQKSGKVETPIAIHEPGGDIEAWFVGVVVNDKLAGFMRFNNDLMLLGYSSFQRQKNSIDECPNAKSWLDPDTVLKRAKSAALPGAHLEQPFLSYDQNSDRIAWAVRTTDEQDEDKLIYVAGEFVYLK